MFTFSRRLKQATTVALMLISANTVAATTIIPNQPTVAAKSYILVDQTTGKVLAAENEHDLLAPASLTKLMTSFIIGRELKSGNLKNSDLVTISENAWAKNFPDSSKMFIEVGKEISVADLNRGIVIQSGNDACVAMAEHIAGTEDGFADIMNNVATELGMTNSFFENSHGLDSTQHKTTAFDMALLARAIISETPEEYALYKEKFFTYNNIKQANRNSLLWDKSMNVDGMKTGHTSKAGFSLVSSATKDNMRLIAVVMGAKSARARASESKKILNYGFRFFETVTPYQAGHEFASQRVWYGATDEVKLGITESTPLTIRRGQSKNLKASFELSKELEAPIAKGEQVGTVFIQLDGKDIASYPLVTLNEVEQGGWFKRTMDYFKQMINGWFS
ncbi:serine hydrolase [Psychrobium sp. MM17-31]|uniref:serine hydrolase n=1 Tax=Psychrobium sp. MM17-31 TaxID=2917758 RepID=UPI001EF69BA3|nr:serine hydrolase [Psychrobium sp. MM17-31]MCG7532024.1 serine hydrolase [Psychrobium sp. MM17-31]